MFAKINDKVIALMEDSIDESRVEIKLSGGRAAVLDNENGLTDQVDMAQISQVLQGIVNEVSSQFVEREEMTLAFMLGLVANEHSFILSEPGTAKTSVAGSVISGLHGKLWRVLMNQDVTKDGIFGTIDPQSVEKGTWVRKWAGLATCDVAVIDEVWKSSGQNANILLDAAEERKVREGDTEVDIPLLSILAMSNEIPEDKERAAIYDRFLIRLSVDYIKDTSNFMAMLTSPAGSKKINNGITTDHLRLLGAVSEYIAVYDCPKDVLETVAEIWRDGMLQSMAGSGNAISDRRWRKTVKLAAAMSLYRGEKFCSEHLEVCRWTLWTNPEDEIEIKKLVMSKTDKFAGKVLNVQARYDAAKRKFVEFKNDKRKLEDRYDELGRLTAINSNLASSAKAIISETGSEKYHDVLNKIVSDCKQMNQDAVAFE